MIRETAGRMRCRTFMHRIALIAAVGCGASSPVRAPPVVTPVAAPAPRAPAAAATATPATPSGRILARLPIRAGAMPGLALEVRTLATASYCGGVSVGVAQIAGTGEALPVDADDFRRVMTLVIPDLDELGRGRDDGMRVANRLGEWTKQALHEFGDVHFALRAHLAQATTVQDEIVTLARLVQLERRFAEVFARAPIPAPFATEPARSGWCDSLAEKVEGLVDAADEDAATCREVSLKAHLAGWWTGVCS